MAQELNTRKRGIADMAGGGLLNTFKESIAASNAELERNTGNTGAYAVTPVPSKKQSGIMDFEGLTSEKGRQQALGVLDYGGIAGNNTPYSKYVTTPPDSKDRFITNGVPTPIAAVPAAAEAQGQQAVAAEALRKPMPITTMKIPNFGERPLGGANGAGINMDGAARLNSDQRAALGAEADASRAKVGLQQDAQYAKNAAETEARGIAGYQRQQQDRLTSLRTQADAIATPRQMTGLDKYNMSFVGKADMSNPSYRAAMTEQAAYAGNETGRQQNLAAINNQIASMVGQRQHDQSNSAILSGQQITSQHNQMQDATTRRGQDIGLQGHEVDALGRERTAIAAHANDQTKAAQKKTEDQRKAFDDMVKSFWGAKGPDDKPLNKSQAREAALHSHLVNQGASTLKVGNEDFVVSDAALTAANNHLTKQLKKKPTTDELRGYLGNNLSTLRQNGLAAPSYYAGIFPRTTTIDPLAPQTN